MEKEPRDMAQIVVGVMDSAEHALTDAELDRLNTVARYLESLDYHRLLPAEPPTQPEEDDDV